MECHAFFCSKRKLADTVTLTVGKIFTSAYEAWRDSSNGQALMKNGTVSDRVKENHVEKIENHHVEEKLIDFDCEGVEDDDWEFDMLCSSRNVSGNNQWVSLKFGFLKVLSMTTQ